MSEVWKVCPRTYGRLAEFGLLQRLAKPSILATGSEGSNPSPPAYIALRAVVGNLSHPYKELTEDFFQEKLWLELDRLFM